VVAWIIRSRASGSRRVDMSRSEIRSASICGVIPIARSHDGRDARGLQGGAPRRDVRLVSCDFPYGPLQEGSESGCAPPFACQGRRRRPGQARRRGRFSRDRALRLPAPAFRSSPQFGSRRKLRLAYGIPYGGQSAPGSAGAARDDGELVEEAKLFGGCGRLASRLHQFRTGAGAAGSCAQSRSRCSAARRRPGSTAGCRMGAHRHRLRRKKKWIGPPKTRT